jgi:uncharacterized protein YdcH (DUF465 family)
MLDGFEEEGIEALKASNRRFAELCSQHEQLNKMIDQGKGRRPTGLSEELLKRLKQRKCAIRTEAEEIALAVMARNTQS